MPGHFHLDPHAAEPIYRQLVTQVKRLVAGGQLVAGDDLPSVRAMAAAHAVNPMTVSKAYALLEAEGVLRRNRGAAMTIAEQALPQAGPIALIAPALEQIVTQAAQLRLAPEDVLAALAARFDESFRGSGE
jgi:GntR family transcriptional regulator